MGKARTEGSRMGANLSIAHELETLRRGVLGVLATIERINKSQEQTDKKAQTEAANN